MRRLVYKDKNCQLFIRNTRQAILSQGWVRILNGVYLTATLPRISLSTGDTQQCLTTNIVP